MKLSVAVVGLGVISRFYLAAIESSEVATLGAVCDPDPERVRPYEGTAVRTFSSAHDLLDAGVVDAVVVTAPNDVHFEICAAALERGCSVCCEKPLAIRVDEAEELVELAKRTETTLLTAFHRRYNRNFRSLVASIDAPVRRATVRYHEDIREHAASDSWYLDVRRCGGGCVADNGPNAFDMLVEVLGPVTVERATVDYDASGADTFATIDVSSAEGVPGRVELDWRYPAGELKDARVELDDGTLLEADLLAGFPEFKSSLWHEYVAILDDFVGAIRRGDERGERGRQAVQLVNEAYARA